MRADTSGQVNWERVEELLLKEDLRRVAMESGEIGHYIIDGVDYTVAPNVVACFVRDGVWRVYETDDRSCVCEERTFDSARSAYEDAAARRGLTLPPVFTMERKENGGVVVRMHRKHDAVQTALQNAKKIAELLEGEEAGAAAAEDAKVLAAALEQQRQLSTDKKALLDAAMQPKTATNRGKKAQMIAAARQRQRLIAELVLAETKGGAEIAGAGGKVGKTHSHSGLASAKTPPLPVPKKERT